jgi:dTDP-4-dehydrorhamnose 3,5-epimerase-like enzyme
MRSQTHPRITTKDKDRQDNGFLIPIYNVHDKFIDDEHAPKQVYLTVVAPGKVKGPHLHMKRWGLFTCIKGNVKVVVRSGTCYEEYYSGENHAYASIEIPAGNPAAIQNIGDIDAYVLNMPCPAWHVDDQDEHTVDDWIYEF